MTLKPIKALFLAAFFQAAAFITPAPADLPAPPCRNHLIGGSFETGTNLADLLTWQRMRDVDYIVAGRDGWQVDCQTAWHGRQSLRCTGTNTLVLPGEFHAPAAKKQPWTFSLYMKADTTGLPCRVQVSGYNNLRQEGAGQLFSVGPEWRRYAVTAPNLPLHRVCKHPVRHAVEQVHGPVNFSIMPLQPGTVWVDAAQWEAGATNSEYMDNQQAELQMPAISPVPPPAGDTPPLAGTGQAAKAWSIPLMVQQDGTAAVNHAAVQLGIPFAAGVWDGSGAVRLSRGAENLPVVQHEILARWPLDASVQSLGLYFTAPLAPGENRFILQPDLSNAVAAAAPSGFLEETPDQWRVVLGDRVVAVGRRNGALWDAVSERASGRVLISGAALEGRDMSGRLYSSLDDPAAVAVLEKAGPAHVSIAKHGVVAAPGAGLLAYVNRLHFWRDVPAVQVEVTVINSRDEGCVQLRELYLKTALSAGEGGGSIRLPWGAAPGGGAGEVDILQYYECSRGEFAQALVVNGSPAEVRRNIRDDVWLGYAGVTAGYFLTMRHGWQQHPAMLGVDHAGNFKAYVWPARPVMGVTFSRGMSITRDFCLAFAGRSAAPGASPAFPDHLLRAPVAFADPAWTAAAQIMLPFHKKDRDKFPFMEASFDALNDMLGPLSPDNIENKSLYGLFDYGDAQGAGGWSNLESFLDYSLILLGLRESAPAVLRQGFTSARHYRDMDINQAAGYTIYHNSNHALGHYDFGHAWPQGVFAHYLLTGSRRSRDVAMRHGGYMLEIPADFGGVKGSRQLARFLLNLADMYQISKDDRYRQRFMAQLEYAEAQMRGDPNPHRRDQTIFPWGAQRLDPYQVWYGCMGLVKMHQLTRDPAILPHLRREVETSLKMDFYRLDLQQIWPGLAPEEGLPIAIALYNARHRGSFFYPLMIAYAEITGEPQWAELALKTLYVDAMEGNHRVGGGAYEVIKTAALSAFPDGVTEAQWMDKVRALMWQAAAPTLLNGDFTESDVWWDHWKPRANRAMAHDDLIGKWDLKTAGSAAQLKREREESKGWYVSPWQYYRRILASLDYRVFKGNAPALRINLHRDWWTGTLTDTARVRLEPGKYRLAGWFRAENLQLAYCQNGVSWLDGRYACHTIPLYQTDVAGAKLAEDSEFADLQNLSTTIAPADKDGWSFLTYEFQAPRRCIISFLWYAQLAQGAVEGHLWLDGVSLVPISAE